MALLLHYTGQDYISRGLLNTELTPGSTSAIVGGCKTGKGFAFDGTVNSPLSVVMPSEPITHSFSLWFKITNIIETRVIATFGQAGFLQFMLWQRTNEEFVFGYAAPDGKQVNLVLNSNLPRGKWYHFAAAIDGRTMRLYLNGVLLQTHTASKDVRKGSDKTIRLGRGTTTNYLDGQICNFKYYNHALSQKEINEDYKSLMLHYKLDKPITTQVFDHSGFNRHITNVVNDTTNEAASKVYTGSMYNSNGQKRCFGFSDLMDLSGLLSMSVSLWFNTSKKTGDQNFFLNADPISEGRGLVMLLRNSNFIAYIGGLRIETPITFDVNVWNHVVVLFNTSEKRLYVNGVSVYNINSVTPTYDFGTTTALSNRSNVGVAGIAGYIQDIRFYAKALTQEDVTELYQTRHEIDNAANGYCYELVEGQTSVEMKANGQLYCDEVIENDTGTFEIVQNKTIKTKEIKEI